MQPFLRTGIAALAAVGALSVAPGTTGASPTAPHATMVVLLNAGATGARHAHLAVAMHELSGLVTSTGGRVERTTSVPAGLLVDGTANTLASLRANPLVAGVYPNGIIHGPTDYTRVGVTHTTARSRTGATANPLCGTSSAPQLNPEALTAIDAPAAWASSTGAGVSVAFMADGIDPTNADLQRNASYASAGSAAGSPVISSAVDFSGDGTGVATGGGEAFLDASSIAAQGNTAYDIAPQGSSVNPLPTAGCYIKVVGSAPGASVTALKVFGQNNLSTNVGFVEAIDYAVSHGVSVLNESFGSNPMPSTTLDLIEAANDAAVAAGVTVVVATGDAGYNSTVGSPADDPNVIAVGATTTLRGYAQTTYGGINAPGANGKWLDNEISSISSGGTAENGRTVDLVAPGDLNWALCSTSSTYADCGGEAVQLTGGTSESAPLVAGAAADVVSAYEKAHAGTAPTPAVVKAILTATATDLGAPATGQGAGLLDVAKAVSLAAHYASTTKASGGGVTASTAGIVLSALPGKTATSTITFTDASAKSTKVTVAGKAFTLANQATGTVTMDPSTATTEPTFRIWSGVNEVYQSVPISVKKGTAYLRFLTAYPDTGQSSLLHVALFDPTGTYAGYSDTQGLANATSNEVANPTPGTWHAILFTYANAGGSGTGTSGIVRYEADTYVATKVSLGVSSVTVAAGKTASAKVTVTMPTTAGDHSISILVTTATQKFTIPATLRTLVGIHAGFGAFSTTVAGGNGRSGSPAQTSTFAFSVPAATSNLEVSLELDSNRAVGALDGSQFVATLVAPSGQVVAEDTNLTIDSNQNETVVPWLTLFANAPVAGTYQVVLQFANPVGGGESSTTLNGQITLNSVVVSSTLPNSASTTVSTTTGDTATVSITNNGQTPLIVGADPRLATMTTVAEADVDGAPDTQAFNNDWIYFVPPSTSSVAESLSATLPASFELTADLGDPSLSPLINEPGVSATQGTTTASLSWSPATGVATGLYGVVPQPTGVFTDTPVASGTATSTFTVTTKELDPAVTSDAGNFVTSSYGLDSVANVGTVINPGETGTIVVTISPTAAVGTVASGTLSVESISVGGALEQAFGMDNAGYIVQSDPQISILGALPYRYTVGS